VSNLAIAQQQQTQVSRIGQSNIWWHSLCCSNYFDRTQTAI